MSSETQGALPVRWGPRAQPLEPLAVVGVGDVARALARRVLLEDDARLSTWSGVAGRDVLVLLGASESLPWVDGVTYLGRDVSAPSLLLPCAVAPEVLVSVLERALLSRVEVGGTPWAVLPSGPWLLSVASARPVHRATLAAWLADEEGGVS
ncbi:hypothetical protein [Myxococcus sp. AB025B]|uniref:bpX5 domain-containing protein n=1 Tax=Myxococcus sp. AB025B TaxID=2562794 RepID=UPI001141E77F|nr:hypothetical protein [Myxococcus sp. AB025B]